MIRCKIAILVFHIFSSVAAGKAQYVSDQSTNINDFIYFL